jgi:hypothetical protein
MVIEIQRRLGCQVRQTEQKKVKPVGQLVWKDERKPRPRSSSLLDNQMV